jgi:hypothetical protein
MNVQTSRMVMADGVLRLNLRRTLRSGLQKWALLLVIKQFEDALTANAKYQ